jgi:hypothetical protein
MFYYTLIVLSLLPIYAAWLVLMATLAMLPILWLTIVIRTAAFVWAHGTKAGLQVISSGWDELASERLEKLFLSFREEAAMTACACVGQRGGRAVLVVHFKSESSEGSWVQKAANAQEAILKMCGKHEARRHAARSGCFQACPIAAVCPNRISGSPYREIFRFSTPAAPAAAA